MCGQVKSTHPEGCPQHGKVFCSAVWCERPNHASLFCQRIKKDVKKTSDTSFPSNDNRNNKRDCQYKGEKSNKKREYKSEDSKDKKKKETSTKINITKRSPDSDDDDFDTHVFMVRDDDDDDIMDEQLTNDGMIDPYWSQPSSPASNYSWELQPSNDLSVYFPYSPAPHRHLQ